MYRLHRIFCATAWETEGERRAFYDALGQFNETHGIPAGTMYVPVSLAGIHDKRPYQYTVDDNIRECRYYILVAADGWGPPERSFVRDYRLAVACAADTSLPMREVALFVRHAADGSPSSFAAALDVAGLPYTTFSSLEDFSAALLDQLTAWLAVDSAPAAPAGAGGASA